MTYIQNIKSRLLSIRQKFPLVDSRLNQIQGVHLKFIEKMVSVCEICNEYMASQQKQTLIQYEGPRLPWEILFGSVILHRRCNIHKSYLLRR